MTEQQTREPISARDTIRQTRVQKLAEVENLPDVMSLMQDQIIKAESNLKDLQESYECAKTYTQLVKQDLARIPNLR